MKRRNSSPNSTQTNEACEVQKPVAVAPQQHPQRIQEFVRDWHTVAFIKISQPADVNLPLVQATPELAMESTDFDSATADLMSEDDFLDLIPINSYFH
ncbi:hypothetical protein GCM10008090_28750 [Arenicella chitinivorans]|uniref:Uncharacterized protein n=1 Tax=Arenicella chitinivorans TaxID=1329800 RepID=A0A918VRW1_9GAMM|nr:hypothetical protein [Arenicella chitinivorans]GHA17307.1 hypothetical protein GCM10008090_28750 [Arenicella chitinivorans]